MASTAPFAAITLLSALLLFLVEPLLARRILPWFGGAQSVWTVCLLFYQTALLVGYSYSHLGRRLGTRRQAWVHVGLLVASAALLPITVSERWKPTPGDSPALGLLGLLTFTIGIPYLVLASTAPLVQGWFARLRPGHSPYWLYALSNGGSLAALLAYPLLIEPLLPVTRQALWWSWGYGGFVLACGALSLAVARGAPRHSAPSDDEARAAVAKPARGQVLLWLALAACGSGLLLALTNHMTMDVAAVPFLWVLPLAIYLATYILAFAGLYRRGTWGALLVVALAAMAVLWDVGFALPLPVQIAAGAAVLFTACLVCHGELARSAPPAGQATTFYVMIAAGGALGGLTVALVAPAVLSDLWELPGFLLSSFALLIVVIRRERAQPAGSGPVAAAPRVSVGSLVLVLAALAAGFVVPSLNRSRGTLATERNFYGVLRVQNASAGILRNQRVLSVGRIFHGGQFIDPAHKNEPTAYYVPGSGPERAIHLHPRRVAAQPLRIGVIGLGVGTMAAWAEAGDTVRFYEINPQVDDFAKRYFTFLRDSRAAATTVALGDGRLTLEGELDSAFPPRFDVLAIDAFSGDAVPVHLLTREAGRLYVRALAPDGVMAFNVTNRHLDIERVARGLAADLGFASALIRKEPTREETGATPSAWLLVTRNRAMLAALGAGSPTTGTPILWTDDFSNLLRVLR